MERRNVNAQKIWIKSWDIKVSCTKLSSCYSCTQQKTKFYSCNNSFIKFQTFFFLPTSLCKIASLKTDKTTKSFISTQCCIRLNRNEILCLLTRQLLCQYSVKDKIANCIFAFDSVIRIMNTVPTVYKEKFVQIQISQPFFVQFSMQNLLHVTCIVST